MFHYVLGSRISKRIKKTKKKKTNVSINNDPREIKIDETVFDVREHAREHWGAINDAYDFRLFIRSCSRCTHTRTTAPSINSPGALL